MKKSKKTISVFTHNYPQWVLKYPNTIKIAYALNYLIQLRKWYVVSEIKKLLQTQNEPFTLLDVGCGEGQYIFPLATKYKTAYFSGIDKYDMNIQFCKRLAVVNNNHNIIFKNESAENIAETDFYTIILFIGVLQYVANDQFVMSKLYNALQQNGRLLMYVPVNNKVITPFFRYLANTFDNYETVQNRQKIYTADQLITLFSKQGFSIEKEVITFGFFGKISNEILNSFLILINRVHIILALWLSVIFILIYPFYLLFMLIDFLLPNDDGNGRLFLLKKC